MEDLEQRQEELRGDMNQLKDQIAQMMEMLKSLDKKSIERTLSAENGEQQTIPLHPLGFTPPQTYTANPQTQQFPPYGLPPGYTPPIATNHRDNHTPVNLQTQQFPLYGLPPGYTPPVATNH